MHTGRVHIAVNAAGFVIGRQTPGHADQTDMACSSIVIHKLSLTARGSLLCCKQSLYDM